jgi:hypothetical protein
MEHRRQKNLFPHEIEILKANVATKMNKPYGALISSTVDLKKTTLQKIERTKGFLWLTNPL